MSLLSKALVWALLLLLLVAGSEAHDTLHYAQSPPEWQKWFGEARTTEESRPRLSAQGFIWHSCCNKADRVKTQFRVNNVNGADEWWFWSQDKWNKVPDDVIHWEADPTMPAQLKVEGVLFIYNGLVTCFWPPEEGG